MADLSPGAAGAADPDPEDLRVPGRGAHHTQKQADGGRLSSAIQSEKPEHLSPIDTQVHPVHGEHVAKALRETGGADRKIGHGAANS
jgi:hypothetical protein